MDKVWYIIAYLIANALDLGITSKYMNFFLGKLKVSERTGVVIWCICFILCSIQYIFFPIPIINITTSFVSLFVIARCYERKKIKIVPAVILVFMFQFACELILGVITGGGNTHLTKAGYYGEVYQLVSLCIMQIILYFIITSFKNINSKLQLPTGFNVAMALLAIVLFFLEEMVFMQEDINRNTKRMAVFFAIFMLILIMYMYDIISRSYVNSFQAKMMERENMYYIKQAEVLQKNSDNIRKFRHDMNNHLFVLESIIDDGGENIQAKEYLEQMIGRINKVKMYSKSGNMQLDSIVNYKLSEASEKNIDIKSDIKLPETLKIDMGDMVTILGNILDNAIEAAHIVDKDKYIKLNIKYKMGAVFITLKNSYNGRINDKNGVLKTIKSNKIEHGIGLNSVQDVVEKYNGEVKIEYDDREFCIRIILYMDNYC